MLVSGCPIAQRPAAGVPGRLPAAAFIGGIADRKPALIGVRYASGVSAKNDLGEEKTGRNATGGAEGLPFRRGTGRGSDNPLWRFQ